MSYLSGPPAIVARKLLDSAVDMTDADCDRNIAAAQVLATLDLARAIDGLASAHTEFTCEYTSRSRVDAGGNPEPRR